MFMTHNQVVAGSSPLKWSLFLGYSIALVVSVVKIYKQRSSIYLRVLAIPLLLYWVFVLLEQFLMFGLIS
jgi:hypothetical protein